MKNYLLIPTIANSRADIAISWRLANSAKGYLPGLMLVIQGGIKGVTENVEKQRQNLQVLVAEYREIPLVVMLGNMPIEEMDFYHNTERALGHVKIGIDFVKSLFIGGRRIVTFHLNTLIPQSEFMSFDSLKSEKIFDEKIAPALLEASRYAVQNNVELKVETVPSPEFGDISIEDEKKYLGTKLRNLRNPYIIYKNAPICNFEKLRSLGLGICLDICHHRTLDVDLLEEVKNLLSDDLVHLNDGSGEFTEAGDCFKEGVVLGKGDISNLTEIIKELNKKNIGMVLEINETDFVNRPNTIASIEYLVQN